MSHSTEIYEIARMYLQDYWQEVPYNDELLRDIEGRKLEALATCSTLVDHNVVGYTAFKHLLQIEAFFKKNSSLDGPYDKRAAAIETFISAEKQCRVTNSRIARAYINDERIYKRFPSLRKNVSRFKAVIEEVLGEASEFLNSVPSGIRITSGASRDKPRSKSSPVQKMRPNLECYTGAKPFLLSLDKIMGYGLVLTDCNLNRVTTVPKNWKTDRTIAAEPSGVMPFQLALDGYLKRRLRRIKGIDLSDQTTNQKLAKIGSIFGTFSTLDLKTASDTLSNSLIQVAVNGAWLDILSRLRATSYIHPQTKRFTAYHKFSSMGNGVTFGLETLVFVAACEAVGCKFYSVYGDDMIVPPEFYALVVRFLRFIGFTVNSEKSFSTGPFRESCGGNYYSGQDLTPFYIRQWHKRHESLMCHNINGLVRIGKAEGLLWHWCRNRCRSMRLLFGPPSHNTMVYVHVSDIAFKRRGKVHWTGTGKYAWQTPRINAYTPKRPLVRTSRHLRGLALWYINHVWDTRISVSYDGPHRETLRAWALLASQQDMVERSSGSWDTPLEGYFRSRVRWEPIPPCTVHPHLYWWGEFLLG